VAAVESDESTSPGEETDSKKRMSSLKVKAEVKDLQRKMSKKWPYILAAVLVIWILAVIIYVLWPASTPIPVVPNIDPIKTRPVDPPRNPSNPEIKTPENSGAKDPEIEPLVKTDKPAVVIDEADAGDEIDILEDRDATLDDFRINEERQKRKIDQNLELISNYLKKVPAKIRNRYNDEFERIKDASNSANTLNKLSVVEDDINDLLKSVERDL